MSYSLALITVQHMHLISILISRNLCLYTDHMNYNISHFDAIWMLLNQVKIGFDRTQIHIFAY